MTPRSPLSTHPPRKAPISDAQQALEWGRVARLPAPAVAHPAGQADAYHAKRRGERAEVARPPYGGDGQKVLTARPGGTNFLTYPPGCFGYPGARPPRGPQRFFGGEDLRTNIYVDGFNLYYRALWGTGFKWLNILEMCRLSLDPAHVFTRLRYFTAEVKPRPSDLDQLKRQKTYLRALSTLPGISIHKGSFLVSKPKREIVPGQKIEVSGGQAVRLADGTMAALGPGQSLDIENKTPPQKIKIYKSEEKGSDVNLATYLLHDGHRSEYQCAVVVSNDSDLAETVRIVCEELRRTVIVLNPAKKQAAKLKSAATMVRQIRRHALIRSQFPPNMVDAGGAAITKPAAW